MTPVDLTALRRLHQAATPGEWVNAETTGFTIETTTGDVVAEYITGDDFAFITAAHTHLPALCDEVEALRARVAELENRPSFPPVPDRGDECRWCRVSELEQDEYPCAIPGRWHTFLDPRLGKDQR